MKALYKNRICHVVDMASDVTLAEGDREFAVSLCDEALVIDPTDSEVADADNFREWCGLDEEGAERFRKVLRGELPADQYRLSTDR